MGTYWDLNKDLALAVEEIIGTGLTTYDQYPMEYLLHMDDFAEAKFYIRDAGAPSLPIYHRINGTDPATAIGYVFLEAPVELSAVTGITQYTGDLYADFGALICPPRYLSGEEKIFPEPESCKNWTVSDGTQIIYFSHDYEGNTVQQHLGKTFKRYVGYGDDDDGSYFDSWLISPYDINFKVNTTGPVVLSAVPQIACFVPFFNKVCNYQFQHIEPAGTGEVTIGYEYRPLHQPKKERFQYSMEFDGTTERLQSEPTSQLLDLAARWSIAAWVKPLGNTGNEQQVYCHGNDSNTNRIHLYRNTVDADNPWVIDIMDPATNQKTYYFGPDLDLDEWYLIGAKYQSGVLTVYVNGVAVTPTDTTQDDAAVMTDTARYMAVGGKNHASASDGFEGRIFWAASWSVNIQAATYLYLYQNPQHLLTEAGGAYTLAMATGLQHWYRPGRTVSPDLGKDYGNSVFDLDDEKDVDDTNLVKDFPGATL